MLYSESKERGHRFLLSLKIAFPFILVTILWGYSFYKDNNFTSADIVLFTILTLCYVYYTVYLIYSGFKKSVVDSITGVFNREEILKIVTKTLKKKDVKNIILIRFGNINDINSRYGYKRGDEILSKITRKFEIFMLKQGFKNVPMGKFVGGHFLVVLQCEKPRLDHILSIFQRKLINTGIDKVEVKLDYAIISSDYDKDIKNIINTLFLRMNSEEENPNIIKPDVFDNLVKYAIDNAEFELRVQEIRNLKSKNNMLALTVKLDSKEIGALSKSKVQNIANKIGYEIKFDEQIISAVFDKIKSEDINSKIFIEVSPVTLRNTHFKLFLDTMISNCKIDPKKIVFEFNEKKYYDEINRFKEILTAFKELGFSFALNQFAGINAGFEYFKKLPIDFIIYDIDINKNFEDKKTKSIFENFNKLSNSIGAHSIVRFVDKKKFYDDLCICGADFVQGFYIDKPYNIELLKG